MAEPTTERIHLGQRLRAVRIARGLTQAELGARMRRHRSQNEIYKFEKGMTVLPADELFDIARILQVDVATFAPMDVQQARWREEEVEQKDREFWQWRQVLERIPPATRQQWLASFLMSWPTPTTPELHVVRQGGQGF